MREILVTGATGFIGGHLVERLLTDGADVKCALRSGSPACARWPANVKTVTVGPIDASTDWHAALEGVHTVIHLAARAHVLEESASDPLQAFREVNTVGTLRLAKAAARAGAQRLVFLSSIKVNGESSGTEYCSAGDEPSPVDPYGLSKLEAEQGLHELSALTGLQTVIVRPPLVYGPGVRANFLRLLRLVDRGIPLPLGSVRNARSLVSVWNLCDLLIVCANAPEAAGQTFMVSDGEDMSTADLIKRLAKALGRRPRLLDVPIGLLRTAARLSGQMAEYTRLCASLRIDMSATCERLSWRPPLSVNESLDRTIAWYRQSRWHA